MCYCPTPKLSPHMRLCAFLDFQIKTLLVCIYIYAFSRRFYPKRLTIAFRLYIFISTCVPWESNSQPFAQQTQCSTTEPHRNYFFKLFGLRGHRHCPHKPPSCCNNHVIIHICVLINHIKVHLHELEFRESSFFLLTCFKK